MTKTTKIVIAVIVIAVIAYFGYSYWKKNKAANSPSVVAPGAPAQKAA